jgi:hypothetical protein
MARARKGAPRLQEGASEARDSAKPAAKEEVAMSTAVVSPEDLVANLAEASAEKTVRPSAERVTADVSLDDLYRQLKELEDQIPVPKPKATVRVGTLDAAAGVFRWHIPYKRETFTMPGKGSYVTFIGEVSVEAVNVDLVFEVVNSQGNFEVESEGYTVTAAPGQSTIKIPVGTADNVPFTVRSGGVSWPGSVGYQAEVAISRYASGAGVFTLEVLPLAIVYCPVQGAARQNRVTYERVEWVGTKMEVSHVTEDSEVDIHADELSRVGESAGKLGDAVMKFYAPAGIALKAFSTIISGVGSDTVREGSALETTTDHAVENKALDDELIRSPEGAGPGEGMEIYVLLQNVQAAWVSNNGEVSIAIFHTPELNEYPTAALAADLEELTAGGATSTERGPRTGLTVQALRDLLALNPFWTPANLPARPGRLPAARFRVLPEKGVRKFVGPTDEETKLPTIVEDEDTRVVSVTATRVEDIRSGWLSFLGIGPSEDKTASFKTQLRNLERRTTGLEIQNELAVKLQAGERLAIRAYYDRVFGTMPLVPDTPRPETE